MKAVVAAFNQEKALVGAFSVITNLRMELFQALTNIPHLPIYPCFMLTVCREYLIFSSNVSDCFSIISWKPSYWVHLTYHRISFHVLPSQRARCSIEWVNKMQHTSPAHSTQHRSRTEFHQMAVNNTNNATLDGSSSAIITDDPKVKMKDQRWFVASKGPWDP